MHACIGGHCVNRDAVAGRELFEAVLGLSQLLDQVPLASKHVVEL
jgi:hypothetical protein